MRAKTEQLECATEILCSSLDVMHCLKHPVLLMEERSAINVWMCCVYDLCN